ncbi:MAG: haloacid dehalogenase-like hydrolase [Verrucomicrobiota bacterium]
MNIPLCVDMDGTLIKGDTLWVSMRHLIQNNPLNGLGISWQFATRGRAIMKEWMSARSIPKPEILPYHTDVYQWLIQEEATGRELILVTGAHRLIAERVAAYTGLFKDIIATENGYNMSGFPKAQALSKKFGEGGYDYAGNSPVDIPVWRYARHIIIVNASKRVSQKAHTLGIVEKEFSRPLETCYGLGK